jgi:hypothetical protein
MNSAASQSSSSRCSGDLALHAEIFRRFDQAHAEKRLPEAIHRHPRRQRIVTAHDPLREAESIVRSILSASAAGSLAH